MTSVKSAVYMESKVAFVFVKLIYIHIIMIYSPIIICSVTSKVLDGNINCGDQITITNVFANNDKGVGKNEREHLTDVCKNTSTNLPHRLADYEPCTIFNGVTEPPTNSRRTCIDHSHGYIWICDFQELIILHLDTLMPSKIWTTYQPFWNDIC